MLKMKLLQNEQARTRTTACQSKYFIFDTFELGARNIPHLVKWIILSMEVFAWSTWHMTNGQVLKLRWSMKLYSLPCILEEDTFRFRTIKLEFSKAKEILEMHMKHVHEFLAFKHRVADLLALADKGCQATCIGPWELSKLGLSKCDLMDVDIRLSGANGSSINKMDLL